MSRVPTPGEEPARGREPDVDDPVARNRATPLRRTPGRTPLGEDVTRRLLWATLAVVAAATSVLILVLLLRR